MADRTDWDRERERGGSRSDWDRAREWHDHGDGPEWRSREDLSREEYARGPERYRDHPFRSEFREYRNREGGRYGESWGGLHSQGWFGRYAGRGPKNYVRSDERIWEDLNERLTEHPAIDASEMEVLVKNGEVTLSGVVEDRRSKHLAEDIAETVSGVKEVYNQLRIHQPAEFAPRGTTIMGRKSERG